MPKTSHNNTFRIKEVNSHGKTRYTIMLYWWDSEGKRHMKRGGSAPTRTRAEQEGQRILADIIKNVDSAKQDNSIRALLTKYREHMLSVPINEEGYRAATKRTYTTNINALINHSSESTLKRNWNSVDKAIIRKWVREITNGIKTNGEPLSPNRVDKLLDVLTNNKRGFFFFLENQGYFDNERADDYLVFKRVVQDLRPKIIRGTRKDRYLTHREFLKFLEPDNWLDNRRDRMYRLAFATLYYSGLRISELRGLRWSDIYLDERLIKIDKSISLRVLKEDKKEYLAKSKFHTPKTAEGQRYVPILEPLLEELKEPMTSCTKTSLCFRNEEGRLLSDNAFTGKLKTQLKKANIKKHLTPHDLRRSFAHFICEELEISFEDAKDIMGHKDTKLLEEVYANRKKYDIGTNLVDIIKNAETKYKVKGETDKIYKKKTGQPIIFFNEEFDD